MTMLSDHFSLEEFTFSEYAQRHGIDNTPGQHELMNLHDLAQEMERVRAVLGYPIHVTSAYRSPKVNSAVGGSAKSEHMAGLACDFTCPGFGSNFEVANAIKASGIVFDQLILEYGWVHIGFADEGQPYRGECLTKRSAAAPYEIGLLA